MKNSTTWRHVREFWYLLTLTLNVLSVRWYIKSYDIFFSCFAAAQSNMIHLCNTNNIVWTRRPGTNWPLAGHVTRFKMVENIIYTIFPPPNFSTFVQRSHKINEKIKLFQSLKENSSWKSFYHWNNRENTTDLHSWFSTCETRNEWLIVIRSYLMSLMDMDWSDV